MKPVAFKIPGGKDNHLVVFLNSRSIYLLDGKL
jgi:hypothetical protein